MSIKYPYTDFHEMNLDWTLETVKKAEKQSADAVEKAEQAVQKSEETEEYVNTYFENLDVQDEIDNTLEGMVQDGTLSNIVNSILDSTLNPVVVQSVNDMTDPLVTYVLASDSHVYQWNGSAFVDTGIVYGSGLGNVFTYMGVLGTGLQLSSITPGQVYFVSFPGGPSDAPEASAAIAMTIGQTGNGAKIQLYILFGTGLIYHRRFQGGAWRAWSNVVDAATSTSLKYKGDITNNFDANTADPQTMYIIAPAQGSVISNMPIDGSGVLITYGSATAPARKQVFYGYSSNVVFYRYRQSDGTTWAAWNNDALQFMGVSADGVRFVDDDCDNAPVNSVYVIPATAANAPVQEAAYLFTIGFDALSKIQLFIGYSSGAVWYRRRILTTTPPSWSTWIKLNQSASGGSGSNPNAKMISFGNSILTGSVWTSGAFNHLAEYFNSPYGNIATAIGIAENNVNHTLISSTGLIYDAGEGTFLQRIKNTNLAPYDVVLTHLWTGDMETTLGSVNSTAADGTIAGAVIDLVNYMQSSNGNAQLILVGVPPVSSSIYGNATFTGNYPNGKNLADCEALMKQLAQLYHFTFIGWQDLNISYHYHDFTDGLNVHANNENTYRAFGGYLGARASQGVNF